MIVVGESDSLLVTGNGDVVQPSDGILGIGSGGQYAVAAARALVDHTQMKSADIVRSALIIASGIDIYTNDQVVVEELACQS